MYSVDHPFVPKMKSPSLAVLVSFFTLASITLAGPPAKSVEQAAKIAQERLRALGLEKTHHVASLVLERDSITSGSWHWIAKYSPAITSGQKPEIGLEIAMDGTLTRLVKSSAPKTSVR